MFMGICALAAAGLAAGLGAGNTADRTLSSQSAQIRPPDKSLEKAVQELNGAVRRQWGEGLSPAPPAQDLAICRRLSLALAGTIPSLEEIRSIERLPAGSRVEWWLNRLLADRRHHDYLAERLARAYVGTEGGPFIVYRRRRFVSWLSDELAANRPYDELVRQLVTDSGLWTDRPATNFLTVTVNPDTGQGPEPSKLAARVSRAFLGVRMDCAECHDHPFEKWTQDDFRSLAAFFGSTQQSLMGIRDSDGVYRVDNLQTGEQETILPRVPFQAALLLAKGTHRERLAAWVTHPDNRAFSRAIANRIWALLMGRPLVEPVDDIRPDSEVPEALDILASDFVEHGYDLRRLIRLIAASEAFRLDSRADASRPAEQVTPEHEEAWASFPITRLRPEQVVGAVQQSASLETIDHHSHILVRLTRALGQSEFVKRYGDAGESELSPQSGTIPERLLLMNGELVHDKTGEDIVNNAVTRIARLASSDSKAVETAYLAVLTRRPTKDEARYFTGQMRGTADRARRMEDLYWALLNSTEFSWNH